MQRYSHFTRSRFSRFQRATISCIASVMLLGVSAPVSARDGNVAAQAALSAEPSATARSTMMSLLQFAQPDALRADVTAKSLKRDREALAERTLPLDALTATMNTTALMNAVAGTSISLSLPNRRAVVFDTEKVIALENGGALWQGKTEARDGRTLRGYVARVGNAVNGHLETDETQIELIDGAARLMSQEGDALQKVFVLDHAALGSSRVVSVGNDALAHPPYETMSPSMQRQADDVRARLARVRSFEKATPTPQSTIDILVAYTAGMVTRYGSTAGVEARLATLIQWANTAYANSEVAITLRLVHSLQVSYPDTGSNSQALNDITGSNGTSQTSVPASLSDIAGLRNTYGADLVALIRPYERTTHVGCGIAWIGGGGNRDIANSAGFGYSVNSDGSDTGGTGFFCPVGTLAHELGHNMGLAHERGNNKVRDANNNLVEDPNPGVTRYAYGYFIPNTSIGDVMSYASTDVQAFSNPNLRCTGSNCSVSGSGADRLGVAADGAPEACISTAAGCPPAQAAQCTTNPAVANPPGGCADASRALNFTRAKVAAFRATAVASNATISGTANAANGTAICANPSAGVSCSSVNASGAYSCTVPNGWTGWLHLQTGNGNRALAKRFASGVTQSQSNQNFSVSSASAFACNLDIDNDGRFNAAIDGVMVLRRLLGFSGLSATVASSEACAQRTDTSQMSTFLSAQNFSVNGSTTSAAREGMVLLRLMLGVSGTQAVVGTGLDWPSVQSAINNSCGTSF